MKLEQLNEHMAEIPDDVLVVIGLAVQATEIYTHNKVSPKDYPAFLQEVVVALLDGAKGIRPATNGEAGHA